MDVSKVIFSKVISDGVHETAIELTNMSNEFEQSLSAQTTLQCWRDMRLTDVSPVFDLALTGTEYVQTRIFPTLQSQSAFRVVAQELHQGPPVGGVPLAIAASAATSPHSEGARPGDAIVLFALPSP